MTTTGATAVREALADMGPIDDIAARVARAPAGAPGEGLLASGRIPVQAIVAALAAPPATAEAEVIG